ncbi:hypothetical protein BH09BAC1_BH09BAC1_26860 [soil metagenome]
MPSSTTWNPAITENEKGNRRKSVITTGMIMSLLLLALFILGMYRQNPLPPPNSDLSVTMLGTTEQGNGEQMPTSTTPIANASTAATTSSQPVSALTSQIATAPVVAVSNNPSSTTPAINPNQNPPLLPGFTGFQSNTNQTGNHGDDNIPGDKGKPTGTDINGDGHDNGDGVLSGRSPLRKERPVAKNDVSGTVRIKITVNAQGKVIAASFSSQGSTTSDSYLKQLSIDAALKWEWSTDPKNRPEQTGFIDFKYAQQ